MQFPATIRWQPCLRPAFSLARWLVKEGSLTAHLEAFTGGKVVVEVLAEHWCWLSQEDSRYLQLAPRKRHRGWCRDVILHVDGKALVRARTLIPRETFLGAGRHLRRQGVKPLGHTLFNRTVVKRTPLQRGYAREEKLWGRRSCFFLEGFPLVVMEFFLPAFTHIVHHQDALQ